MLGAVKNVEAVHVCLRVKDNLSPFLKFYAKYISSISTNLLAKPLYI